MKAIVALIFLGVVAVSYAGVAYTSPLGYTTAGLPLTYSAGALPLPYAYNAGFYPGLGYTGDYQLKLDTTGSTFATYPYAAAPTAYGYGVIKV